MPLCTIPEALAELKQGKMIILVDDEDRENEGDLTMAAEFVTPEAINFMAHHCCGLICLALAPELCDKLALPPEWLAMLPPEAEDTPDAGGPFPRVSLELRLAGGLGSRADVRAELTAHALWPQDEAPACIL